VTMSRTAVLVGFVAVFSLVTLPMAGTALAQPADPDTLSDDSQAQNAPVNRLDVARQAAANAPTGTQANDESGPFIKSFTNKPKAGALANVRQYTYFWELVSDLKFERNSSFRNKLEWSWDDYRRQEKTVEKRNNDFTYALGNILPATVRLGGRWNWSEDKTVNSAGIGNLNKRDQRRLQLSAMKSALETGPLVHIIKGSGSYNKQISVNQNQRNNFQEAIFDGGLQTGMEVAEGVSLAGRIYGMATSGDRALGASTSPSTASGDSLGFGVYYARNTIFGRAAVTRSNFQKNYLDFRRNSNALIDTVGLPDDEKVLNETETDDAVTMEFVNNIRLGRFAFDSRLARDTKNLDFASSGVGLRQRQQDFMQLSMSYAVGRDSVTLGYDWKWRWDDQRYKNATSNRGRQNIKDRDWELNWNHRLFTATNLSLRYHQKLVQDIAENRHNENDKDRLQTDFGLKAERNWLGRFRASMVFAYSQVQDISIRESKSANNNAKDSYEIAPSYTWSIAPWLSLDQSYRLYIQYTNYNFSNYPGVSREDNYNKRGNLATRVIIDATTRLTLTIRHDYNKRFSATKLGEDATGGIFYNRDLNQRISKIDLGMIFQAAPGVTFEAATYRTRDDKTNLGSTVRESTNLSGEMWVGLRAKQRWGRANPLELSGMVRKYNAFGPSVTETSADYWEADIWVKWEF